MTAPYADAAVEDRRVGSRRHGPGSSSMPPDSMQGGQDEGFGIGIDLVTAARGLPMAQIEELVAPADRRSVEAWHEGPSVLGIAPTASRANRGTEVRLLVAPDGDAAGVARSLVLWLGRRAVPVASVAVELQPRPRAVEWVSEASLVAASTRWAGPGRTLHRFEIEHGRVVSIGSRGADPILGDLSDLRVGVDADAVREAIEGRVGTSLTIQVESEHNGSPMVVSSMSADGWGRGADRDPPAVRHGDHPPHRGPSCRPAGGAGGDGPGLSAAGRPAQGEWGKRMTMRVPPSGPMSATRPAPRLPWP